MGISAILNNSDSISSARFKKSSLRCYLLAVAPDTCLVSAYRDALSPTNKLSQQPEIRRVDLAI